MHNRHYVFFYIYIFHTNGELFAVFCHLKKICFVYRQRWWNPILYARYKSYWGPIVPDQLCTNSIWVLEQSQELFSASTFRPLEPRFFCIPFSGLLVPWVVCFLFVFTGIYIKHFWHYACMFYIFTNVPCNCMCVAILKHLRGAFSKYLAILRVFNYNLGGVAVEYTRGHLQNRHYIILH